MKIIYTLSFLLSLGVFSFLKAQSSLGTVQENTNPALPESYNFKEYVYAEPNDQGDCLGVENTTAIIEQVFMAQTHRHALDHPFFFTIGYRPALLQLAVTGSGVSPDVAVRGTLNGNDLGILCMSGPEVLPTSINLTTPNFEDYFSVTLPKSWIQDGLELTVSAGLQERVISPEELKIGPYTEMNLVMVNMDLLDYNGSAHQWPIFQDFLEEVASAIPASVVRFGVFPETLAFPEAIANNETEQLVRLRSRGEMASNGILSDGYINSIASLFLGNLHTSTNDYLSTVYFGNTLNLAPGGWGGGRSFVSFDFTDVFIHELGHALSLPHWGAGAYENSAANEYQYNYPYGGEGDDGGGRGSSWNFIQDTYEFVNPNCLNSNSNMEERSDCMQRNNPCTETRSDGQGPWDGFGDFSTLAMHRYLMGGSVLQGEVMDRGEVKEYQFNVQGGFPVASLQNGKRSYQRDAMQPDEIPFDHQFIMPGEEKLNQDVYLIYGSAHETQEQVNIIYKPIKYNGTLPPIIDPTNSETLQELRDPQYIPHYYGTRDITLKMTYADGSVLHALNPFHSYARAPYTWGYHIWRDDVCNFSLVVPGDKELVKVELYQRPFCIRYPDDDTPGNLNYEPHNIEASSFMDEAIFQAAYEFGKPSVLGSNTIGNRVWLDANKNGVNEEEEFGIPGVTILLWADSDGDQIPDSQGFSGFTQTDTSGYYSFTGLGPGNYLVFVWSLENWGEGEALFEMKPTEIYEEDPNTDINLDNNGRRGGWPGLTDLDIASGVITLSAAGEPLDDGDREDCWFDYDPSGNMTVDFGFYSESATDLDGDGFTSEEDCDDNNSMVNPSVTELPYNGMDDDCDPLTLDDDLDQDGYVLEEDCDDVNAEINPGADEITNNGIDEDCDGMDLMSSVYELENVKIKLFPNPADDHLNIVVDGLLDYELAIFNLQGKLIYSALSPQRLEVASFENGLYLIQVKSKLAGHQLTHKLMVVH